MSRNLVVPFRIQCDGDGHWPCRNIYESSSTSTLRETRADAKRAGWAVAVSGRYGRTRLDYCPLHAPAAVGLAPEKEK